MNCFSLLWVTSKESWKYIPIHVHPHHYQFHHSFHCIMTSSRSCSTPIPTSTPTPTPRATATLPVTLSPNQYECKNHKPHRDHRQCTHTQASSSPAESDSLNLRKMRAMDPSEGEVRKQKPQVIVIAGPSGIGKSHISILLAQYYNRLYGVNQTPAHTHARAHSDRQSESESDFVNGSIAEIISADSVQLYRDLDIGSNKVTADERAMIPHHLIDVTDLSSSEHWSVAHWYDAAIQAIKQIHKKKWNIHSQGKEMCVDGIPIVVGGAGFYIRWLLFGKAKTPESTFESKETAKQIIQEVRANIKTKREQEGIQDRNQSSDRLNVLRNNNSSDYVNHVWNYILHHLQHARSKGNSRDKRQQEEENENVADATTATATGAAAARVYDENVDLHESYQWLHSVCDQGSEVRFERAVEILLLNHGMRPETYVDTSRVTRESLEYDYRCFYLYPSNKIWLQHAVNYRCEQMISNGLLHEVISLQRGRPVSIRDTLTALSIGYKQSLMFLDELKNIDKSDRVKRIQCFQRFLSNFQSASRRYIRRQMTWFRQEPVFDFLPLQTSGIDQHSIPSGIDELKLTHRSVANTVEYIVQQCNTPHEDYMRYSSTDEERQRQRRLREESKDMDNQRSKYVNYRSFVYKDDQKIVELLDSLPHY